MQLPISQSVFEITIFRDTRGKVVFTDSRGRNLDTEDTAMYPQPHTVDTGIAVDDSNAGEGSVPAIIPADTKDKLASFIVINMTRSQHIDNVNFKMDATRVYSIGRINAKDRQSIALGFGAWETKLTYTRNGKTKTLGPLNAIIVSSTDPQAVREHYLYFYLNTQGEYATSQVWPPVPYDVNEDDLLPPDNGYGRSLIKIINNSYARVMEVTIENKNGSITPPRLASVDIDYEGFTPSVPIQYKQIGFVDVVGTENFPIEPHENYLIKVKLQLFNGEEKVIERVDFIKDLIVTIEIKQEGWIIPKGATFIVENKAQLFPVQITGMIIFNKETEEYTVFDWASGEAIGKNQSKTEILLDSEEMPITEGAKYAAGLILYMNGNTDIIEYSFSPDELYSATLTPDQNIRRITFTDSDVPDTLIPIGALFEINNNVVSWPIEITGLKIINQNNPGQNTEFEWDNEDDEPIRNGGSREELVFNSSTMPITANAKFKAELSIRSSNGQKATLPINFSPAELYSETLSPIENIRTITIEDSDIPQGLRTARVRLTLINGITDGSDIDLGVNIVGLIIENKANTQQAAFFDEERSWEPNGPIANNNGNNRAVIEYVNDTPAMPIIENAEYQARVTLSYGNMTATTEPIDFSPNNKLYSAGDYAERSITVEYAHLPKEIIDAITGTGSSDIGATIIIKNEVTDWPVLITGITVRNNAITAQSVNKDPSHFDPPYDIEIGEDASLLIMDSDELPVIPGVQYEYRLSLALGDKTGYTTYKNLPKSLYLADSAPADNTQTVILNNSDVPQTLINTASTSLGVTFIIKNELPERIPYRVISAEFTNKDNNAKETKGMVINNGDEDTWQVKNSPSKTIIVPGAEYDLQFTLRDTTSNPWNPVTFTIPGYFSPEELSSNLPIEQNIRYVNITENDLPDEYRYAYSNGAIVTVKNEITSWPIKFDSVTFRQIDDEHNSISYHSNDLGTYRKADITVTSRPRDGNINAFIIKPGTLFVAQILLNGPYYWTLSGQYTNVQATIYKYFDPVELADLYTSGPIEQNTRTITITDEDVPEQLKYELHNATWVTLVHVFNQVSPEIPITVTGVKIYNIDKPEENSSFSLSFDNSRGGQILLGDDPEMPIKAGYQFKAEVTLFGNGKFVTITKDFDNPELFSDNPIDTYRQRMLIIGDADVPDSLMPEGVNGADLTIKNNVTIWPVLIDRVEVRNKYNFDENAAWFGNRWDPRGSISQNKSARFRVSSLNMPITEDREFEAVITYSLASGIPYTVIKAISPAQLYNTGSIQDNTRTITLEDADVENQVKAYVEARGARFIIENNISADLPITIEKVKILNNGGTVSQDYPSSAWNQPGNITNGNNAQLMVMSKYPTFMLLPGMKFSAEITLESHNNRIVITKSFSPAELFTTLPATLNVRTITITTNDVPAAFKAETELVTKKKEILAAAIGQVIRIDGRDWVKVRTANYTGVSSATPAVLLLYMGVLPGNPPYYQWNTRSMKSGSFYHGNRDIGYFYEGNFYSNHPTIESTVNSWYKNLNSPILKQIHMSPGSSLNESTWGYIGANRMSDSDWNKKGSNGQLSAAPATVNDGFGIRKLGTSTNYDIPIAFVPSYYDIGILRNHPNFRNGYDYWIRDVLYRYYSVADKVGGFLAGLGSVFTGSADYVEFKYVGFVRSNGSVSDKSYKDTAAIRPAIWVSTD